MRFLSCISSVLFKKITALCEDAGKLFGFLDGLLSTVNGALEDFMEEPLFPTDPLEPERNLEFPEGGGKDDILSLRGNGGGPIGSIVRDMIEEADIFLGDMVEDEDGNSDLAINNWLRNNLLADDGSFSLDLNTVIYEGHDRLAKTEIELQAIRVYGLDTFTAFEPITTLGEYTLENRVAWEYLSVEVQIQANLTTSSLPDSLFVSTTPLTTLETLHLAVNVTDLDIGLALLIAANRMSIESTPVGGLLLAETLLPCVVAAMEDVGLSALNVSVGDLSEPEVDGFASPGFDRIMSTLIKAVFAMYKPSLLRSIPSAMDSTVRKLINEDYLEPLLNETCQEPTTTKSGSVDWRDLLLPPSEAEQLGGSGDSPMGNLAHWLKGVLMDRLVKVEEGNVLPEVNPIAVRPLTRAQSGVDGTLELEDDLIDVSTGLGDTKLEFTVTGVTVENLDTVRLPLEILEPTQQASVMRNELSMGLEDRPISLEVTLAVGLEGGFVPNGKSYNEIAIRTTVDSVELAAEISAWVSASAFMSLPLGDAMRPDCLMALLQSPNSEAPLSFSRFSTVLSALTLDVRCVECPGPGGVAVPELVKELLQPGVTELLAGRFAEVLASVAESESMEMLAENFINDAPRFCQSSADYSANATRSNLLSGVGFPQLTPVGVDTLFYSGIVAVWSGLVVLSEAQIDSLTEETNPLSAQDSFVPPNARLVDWTDLGNSTGLGSLADDAFDYINDYLTREVDNGDLGINSLLRDWLVDGSTLDLPVENFGFDLSGFVLAVDRIRASGLDSFRGFGGLRALGAQTLGIDMELAALEVEMDISARYSGSSSPPQSMTLRFGVENVTLSVALFAAIDVDKVGDLTIGSLLSSRHILPCALSTAYSLQIPSLKMSFDAFSGPTIAGLMDETASSVAQFLSSTSEVYRESIMEAFPKLIEGPVRNILTELLDDNTSDRSCSQLTAQDPSSYIDFRDLLLSRSESLQLGGAGDARHGDVVPLLWGLVKDEMLSISSNGLARVNELLIAPLTKAQSGVTGTLRIVDNLVSEQLSFATIKARLGLRVSDVHVENLDTVGSPLSLLKPLDNEGHVLNNVATIGVGKPVRFGARLFFSVGTECKCSSGAAGMRGFISEINPHFFFLSF